MSDIHVTYRWIKNAAGNSAELVCKKAALDSIQYEGDRFLIDHLEDLSSIDVRELRPAARQLQAQRQQSNS